MPMIKLQTSDNEIVEVDSEIACMFTTLRNLLDSLGTDEDNNEPIPVQKADSTILRKVIEWATYHKNDPPIPDDDETCEKRTDKISSWDADFFKVDLVTLFEILIAANYLDIKGLFDVACQTAANMITGKKAMEICKTLDVDMHFNPQEKEKVCRNDE